MSAATDALLAAGWTRTPGVDALCWMQREGYADGEMCHRRAIWSHPRADLRFCLTHARFWVERVEAVDARLL